MNALERVPCFSLDRLPRGPKWDELEKLLTTSDCSTLQGRRDYAVLMVLITYGVRAGQLVSLRLEDVHWREGTIVFPAVKDGRSIKDPLTPAVGRALATYLRESGQKHRHDKCSFLSIRRFCRLLPVVFTTLCLAPLREPGLIRHIAEVMRFDMHGRHTPWRKVSR